MIAGFFWEGSGLGNQLHRYVATRVLAADKGFNYGMIGDFKGSFFLYHPNLISSPEQWIKNGHLPNKWEEKKVVENGVDIRGYDPEINFVQDNTVIDGEFQDERYFKHRLDEVREWLAVEPTQLPDDLCIIGFRGGEYTAFPDLFLDIQYWNQAIAAMRSKYPKIRFEVHTDDIHTAHQFFPEFHCIHDMALNWRSVRYAKHLIIANSSFFILPSLLNQDVKEVIAPRYWARRNTKVWALPQNYYSDPRWMYI